jgi:hypothetical protein
MFSSFGYVVHFQLDKNCWKALYESVILSLGIIVILFLKFSFTGGMMRVTRKCMVLILSMPSWIE